MASICTKGGDGGQTSLVGGVRISKASLRVETYGTVDELNSAIGFARSICDDVTVCESALRIQRELFGVGAFLAMPVGVGKDAPPLDSARVDALTDEVYALEQSKDILFDWAVPGANPAGAAFDLARAICRRAERCVVRLSESGEAVDPSMLVYLNRLSDLLWLFSRKVEGPTGKSLLRDLSDKEGPRWSRAW